MVSAAFEEAYNNAKNINGGTQDDGLELYAYNKIARGEDITKAPKPGMMDFQGKYKRSKWEEVLKTGLTPEEAEKKYIEKFEQMKEKYGLK